MRNRLRCSTTCRRSGATDVDRSSAAFTLSSRLPLQNTFFSRRWIVKLYTLFKTQHPENHTLFSGTYPYRPNKGRTIFFWRRLENFYIYRLFYMRVLLQTTFVVSVFLRTLLFLAYNLFQCYSLCKQFISKFSNPAPPSEKWWSTLKEWPPPVSLWREEGLRDETKCKEQTTTHLEQPASIGSLPGPLLSRPQMSITPYPPQLDVLFEAFSDFLRY